MTAFRWGLSIGFLAAILLAGLLWVWMGPELYRPRFNVEVISTGADVSRQGGAKVVVRNEQGIVAEQTCRDQCDDFELRADSGDNSFSVRVLDAAGQSLAGGDEIYVTGGYGAWITRWTVSGADTLQVRLSTLHHKANGTFEEKPLSLPLTPNSEGPSAHAPAP
jgi:hypothetical protein